ncbi:hypothetical protein IV203_024403 [Nitzschia inconspicua]|uniref:Uncharacterized protein n=1 Tax=Nitzschia inconspicua TaxID=303405 RepID=A0A9K3KCT9_9STRA|nr:hypothetical protein IV203_024403 [Nitzschia inconspicua]
MSKCWRRYSTLIQVIGRVWPGFVPMLLVHLVDFVLTIENEVISARWMDPSSARKLYFLYGWIQFVLSQRFVASLDDAFRVVHDTEAGVVDDKSKPKQRNDYFDGITMARLEHLQCLEYPLYSLLERCRPIDETNITTTTTTTTSTLDNGDDDPRSTSKGIHDCLLDILGSQSEQLQVDTANAAETQYLESHDDDQNVITTTTATTNTETTEATKLSLDDMEALLAEEKDENDSEDGLGENHDGSIVTAHNSSMTRPASCAWRRCDVWDPCAIGTLPGYPA